MHRFSQGHKHPSVQVRFSASSAWFQLKFTGLGSGVVLRLYFIMRPLHGAYLLRFLKTKTVHIPHSLDTSLALLGPYVEAFQQRCLHRTRLCPTMNPRWFLSKALGSVRLCDTLGALQCCNHVWRPGVWRRELQFLSFQSSGVLFKNCWCDQVTYATWYHYNTE